jgi:hypothetical protein
MSRRRQCPYCFESHPSRQGDDGICPSPEEIAVRAAAIPATWSSERLAKRGGCEDISWRPPTAEHRSSNTERE